MVKAPAKRAREYVRELLKKSLGKPYTFIPITEEDQKSRSFWQIIFIGEMMIKSTIQFEIYRGFSLASIYKAAFLEELKRQNREDVDEKTEKAFVQHIIEYVSNMLALVPFIWACATELDLQKEVDFIWKSINDLNEDLKNLSEYLPIKPIPKTLVEPIGIKELRDFIRSSVRKHWKLYLDNPMYLEADINFLLSELRTDDIQKRLYRLYGIEGGTKHVGQQ
ncbi:hypothetical protein [Thermococcus sp.]|uniref:hypothetical protein n=1 Tax=Thermococcus sp. TaxID=35749 RepID=UPI002635990C|nr:hypothetical protein [Thermococcus sp.]MCD6143683.1 hypothetical protein [Thermococcus sp.]